jgi:hypothetical protein
VGRLLVAGAACTGEREGVLAAIDGTRGAPAVTFPANMDSVGIPAALQGRLHQFHSYLYLDPANRPVLWTDHAGVSRLFHVRLEGCDIISDDPALLGRMAPDADHAMVGSFLANGFMLNDRTLFSQVRALPTASEVRLGRDLPSATAYWEHRPGLEPVSDPQRLEDELWDTLSATVSAHAAGHHVLLALSGGIDSAILLGLLHHAGADVTAFSYVNGPPHGRSDASVAARRAGVLDVEHWICRLDDTQAASMLRTNLMCGMVLKGLCFEIDAFPQAAARARERLEAPLFMFGDHVFGQRTLRLDSDADMLGGGMTKSPKILAQFMPLFGEEKVGALQHELAGAYGELLASAPGGAPDDVKDWMYYRTSMSDWLVPMRAGAAGSFLPFSTPFYDLAALDLLKRHGVRHRLDKRLLRDLFRKRMPRIARHETSRRRQIEFDFRALLERGEREVRDLMDAGNAHVPGLAGPEDMHAMLTAVLHPAKTSGPGLGKRAKRLGEQAFRGISRRGLVPLHWLQPVKRRLWNTHDTFPETPILMMRALQLGLIYGRVHGAAAVEETSPPISDSLQQG